MRVRTIELRILAMLLVVLWFVTCGLVLIGYRPGGPVDVLVGLAAIGPVLIAVAAVAWPPVARGDRAFAGIAWLGLFAVLLLVPSIAGVITQLVGRGPQTLLPSFEAAYPWGVALIATGLYAGLGIARRRLGGRMIRRRRLLVGAGIALLMVLAAGSVFGAVAIVNELALGNRPAIASRFGPTDPDAEVPPCTGALAAGSTARLDLRLDASVDDRRTGQVVIAGIRNGRDVRWNGFAATRLLVGQVGAARVGERAWERQPGTAWTETSLGSLENRDLDVPLINVALTPETRSVAEDRGLSYIEGARARHCRITIDGDALRRALPEVSLLIGQTDISRWRVDLDYWVFADGQLGQADGRATGPAGGLESDALLAALRFRLTAVDRGLPVTVFPPTR
ncbi:MAG TPA: hypothetical protein VIZ22_08235 [Candidatus Limnocylindrales bacterium]